MTSGPTRSYGGISADERVQQRRTALIEAALDLADADGWRQLTVEHVCRKAGLNKRYFYESFADLEALACGVVDQVADGWQAVAIGALDPSLSRPDLAVAVLTAVVQYMTSDPRRSRLLFGELQASRPMEAHRTRAVAAITEMVTTQARDIHHENDSHDPIARITATLLLSGTGQVVLDWLDGGLPISQDQLVEELAALWVITGDGAADRASQRVG